MKINEKKIIYNEKRKKKFEQKILMGYCPFCIVREEKNCIAREFVLQGISVVRLYCKIGVG